MGQVEAGVRKRSVVWGELGFGRQGPLVAQTTPAPSGHTLFFLLGASLCPSVSRCGQRDHCGLGL